MTYTIKDMQINVGELWPVMICNHQVASSKPAAGTSNSVKSLILRIGLFAVGLFSGSSLTRVQLTIPRFPRLLYVEQLRQRPVKHRHQRRIEIRP
jgi:hypothetical protein